MWVGTDNSPLTGMLLPEKAHCHSAVPGQMAALISLHALGALREVRCAISVSGEQMARAVMHVLQFGALSEH